MKSALAVLLIFASAPNAAAGETTVAPESIDRFLSGVRDFAGGRLTPGPHYDPESFSVPAGPGASAIIGTPSQMNYFNPARTASWRAANGNITSGAIMRNTITHNRIVSPGIVRQTIAPQQIIPQQIVSPWRQ